MRRYSRFTFVERTLLAIRQKSWEPHFWQVIISFVLVAYARTLLQWLLACLNFILDSEDLFYWNKWKKWFLYAMVAAQAAENHGRERGLTWYLQLGIYTSIPAWIHSQNSLAAAETLSLKISSHRTSLKWSWRMYMMIYYRMKLEIMTSFF